MVILTVSPFGSFYGEASPMDICGTLVIPLIKIIFFPLLEKNRIKCK